MLESNLRLLARRSRVAADAIEHCPSSAHSQADIRIAPDGGLTGWVGIGPTRRQLASLRGPIVEGERLAQTVDITKSATIVVRGLGCGHHATAVARRLAFHGAVIAFEPDVALLRALLERADYSALLGNTNFVLVTDPADSAALSQGVSGLEAVLASGTTILDQPASRVRLGAAADHFSDTFATVMKAVRTSVITTLVQVDVTVRNLLQNVRWYVGGDGIAHLADSAKGRPAVIVSAGPSLRRNIELLSAPGVRDRVVIIAVQTVLNQLLAKGIKPHFVTALDYHEISTRFYEGLTAKDVEGVTLVVEPKVNPAVPRAFPGKVLCAADGVLDEIIGPDLVRPMGTVPPGATVAHLSYYLARFLGCDPVILVGQDLGFSDGQYYSPGAAIHTVWGSELNEFNTLEMLEWQRIARMRSMLRKAEDVNGRTIYTDEQMSTYLVQFERDFQKDVANGLTVIDATEGGVRKRHTSVSTLVDALRLANDVPLPAFSHSQPADPSRLTRAQQRLDELERSAGKVSLLSRRAAEMLAEMRERQHDQARVNTLIGRVHELGAQACTEPAYGIVQYVNQTGQLNRYKADRAKELATDLDDMARQRLEIERDLANVRWLGDVAEHVRKLLNEAATTLRTGTIAAREITTSLADPVSTEPRNVWAAMPLSLRVGALGTARSVDRPFLRGRSPLEMTLATLSRLAQDGSIQGVVVLVPESDIAEVKQLLSRAPSRLRIECVACDAAVVTQRAIAIGTGRLWSRWCWRGGIANLSCYDEVVHPSLLAPVMQRLGIDAVLALGPDWALVDEDISRQIITRYHERPDKHNLVFTQAPPGLAPCLASRGCITELAAADGPFATIGALLGYVPIAPQSDPIAKSVCVQVHAELRDVTARCIPDSDAQRRWLEDALAELPERADALTTARRLSRALATHPVEHIRLRITRETRLEELNSSLARLTHGRDDLALSIRGADGFDALLHPALPEIMHAARAAGVRGVHVRTRLTADPQTVTRMMNSHPDVVSVDLLAESTRTYTRIAGSDSFDTALANLASIIETSRRRGMPSPWIVPRITRRDESLEEIEIFYNRWLMACGACIIDPREDHEQGTRIEPLPRPAFVEERSRRTETSLVRGVMLAARTNVHPAAAVAISGAAS